MQFDSPVSVEYAWNDPTLSNARSTTLGDLDGGTAEFLIKERIPGQLQFGAGGIDFLLPDSHALLPLGRPRRKPIGCSGPHDLGGYRVTAADLQRQRRTIRRSRDSAQHVRRRYWRGYRFGVDRGSGRGRSGCGNRVCPGRNQPERERRFRGRDLAGRDRDRPRRQFPDGIADLRYDYLTPTIDLLSISDSTQLFDGRFITTSPDAELLVEFADDASGLDRDSLRWSVTHATTLLLASGSFEPTGIDQSTATVTLNEGYNYLTLHASDEVGNSVSRVVTVILARGYAPELGPGDRPNLDFGNAKLPSIAGLKFADASGDGLCQDGEVGVEGVTIYLDLDLNGAFEPGEPSVVTDDRGGYRFENLLPGTYHLREIVPVGWQQVAPADGVHVIDVGFGDVINDADFANMPPGTGIAGVVFDDLDGDGVRDAEEPGVEGATIGLDLDQDGFFDQRTATLADGSYLFDGLAAGEFSVSFEGLSGFTLSSDRAQKVTLADGETRNDLDFGVYRPVTVSGQVFEDLNRDREQQFFESNLSGWTIEVDLGNDGTIDASAESDASGYAVPGLPPGKHRISLVAQDGFDPTLPADGDGYLVQVESGADESDLDFGLFDKTLDGDPTASVSGLVFEDLDGDGVFDSGEPRRGDVLIDVVAAESGELLATTRTRVDGRYQLTLLSGVNYRLRIDLPEGFGLTTSTDDFLSVNPQPGETIPDLNFGLFAGTRIAGTVFEDGNANGIFDPSEKTIDNVLVTLALDGSGVVATVRSGEDGQYEFVVADSNRYTVTSELAPGFVATVPVRNEYTILPTDPGLQADLDFGHFDGTRIAGQVFNDRNGNSVRNPGEPGVNDQRIEIVDAISGIVEALMLTAPIDIDGDGTIDLGNETGGFNFALPRASYFVRLVPQSNWPATTPTEILVLQSEQLSTDLEFGVLGQTRLEGTVFDDEAGDGERDPQDKGLAGVEVHLLVGTKGVIATAITDDEGHYEFAVTPNREYMVAATSPDGTLWTNVPRDGVYTEQADEGETVGGLDFGYFTLITLRGNLFNDQDGDGSAAGDPPLPDWTLALDLDGDGDIDRTTTTDAGGDYEFADVGPGQHFVRQSRPEGWSRTTPVTGQHVIDAASGQDIDDLDFGNQFTLAILSGQVFRDINRNGAFDDGETGLHGWTVEVIDPSNQAVVATVTSDSVDLDGDNEISADEVGRYRAIVPPGQYEIRQTPRPNWTQWSPVRSEVLSEVNTQSDWFPDDSADSVAFSRDGRFVTWGHSRGNSLPGIENRKPRIFVHDRISGSTDTVDLSELPGFNDPDTRFFSVTSFGLSLSLTSDDLRISDDGRFVFVKAFFPAFLTGQFPSAYVYDRVQEKFEPTGDNAILAMDGNGDTQLTRNGLRDRVTGVNRALWDPETAESAALSWDGNHAVYVQLESDPNESSRRQRYLYHYDDTTGEHHRLTDLPLVDRGSEVIVGSVVIDDFGDTIAATIGTPTTDDPGLGDYSYQLLLFDRTTGATETIDTANLQTPGGIFPPGRSSRSLSISGDGRFVVYGNVRYDRDTDAALYAGSDAGHVSRDGEIYSRAIDTPSDSFVRFSESGHNDLIDVAAGATVDRADFANANFRPVIDPIADVAFAEDSVSPPIILAGIFDAVDRNSTVTLTRRYRVPSTATRWKSLRRSPRFPTMKPPLFSPSHPAPIPGERKKS